jgi:hypothetical protein
MLDHEHQPPARLVAQMRALTREKGLSDEIGDRLAAHTSMTADIAGDVVKAVKSLRPVGEQIGFNDDAVLDVVLKAMPKDGKPVYADMREAAFVLMAEEWKNQGDTDVPMHGRPTVEMGHSWDNGPGMRAKYTAALAEKIMPTRKPEPMAAAHRHMAMSEIAMQVCRSHGLKPFDASEAVRMAMHSTSDFPLILADSLSNVVARRMQQNPPAIARASHEVQRDDYRQGNSLTLSATGMPQEIVEGGEIKFVTANEGGELLPRLRDFGSGFNISNQALVNDGTATGLLGDMAARMTEGATERLAQVLLEPIVANSYAGQNMRDGNAMFTTDRGNLAASGGAISVTTLSAARLALRKAKGLNGEHLAVEPWGLMVPPELETTAQQVLAELMAAKFSDVNPFSNSLELIVEPRLAEAAGWYLLANPTAYDGLAHAFLNGQSAPRVETREGWETLGLEMRLTWALDAKFIQTATWYRNPGA